MDLTQRKGFEDSQVGAYHDQMAAHPDPGRGGEVAVVDLNGTKGQESTRLVDPLAVRKKDRPSGPGYTTRGSLEMVLVKSEGRGVPFVQKEFLPDQQRDVH